jgi:hypothetical protein
LGAQLKQKLDDEDERIREAVQEAEEKRAKEEAEKEAKMKVAIQSQAEHRHLQVNLHHFPLYNVFITTMADKKYWVCRNCVQILTIQDEVSG